MRLFYSKYFLICGIMAGTLCLSVSILFICLTIADPNQEVWSGNFPISAYLSLLLIIFSTMFAAFISIGCGLSYIKINKKGIFLVVGIQWWKRRYILWDNVQEVGLGKTPTMGKHKMLYFSERKLTPMEREWVTNIKNVNIITVVYRKKVKLALHKYMPKNLTLISVNGKEEI